MNTKRVAALAAMILVASLPPGQALAAQASDVTFTADRPLYLVDEGSRARVGVTVSTADGLPLAAPAGVDYATAPGSATPGSDYTPAQGTITFPAGTASGTTKWFTLNVMRGIAPETAETVTVQLAGAAKATVVIGAHGFPYLNPRLPIDVRVTDLMSRMTLEEKIGQMTQAERGAVTADPTVIAQWRLGSLLSGGGSTPATNTPAAWVEMVNGFQAQAMSTRLQIPLIYGIDAVHGHGNVYGATIFPHNIGLGATRDAQLVEQIGRATGEEVRATGIPWSFSPCVCVARDERWGRTYESFGEDPSLALKLETIIDGLQSRVLATVKHFAGDGDTEFDAATAAANAGKPWWEQKYTIDQGVTVTSRRDFERLDLAQYFAAVRRHDVGSVMPSYSSVDWTEDGVGNPVKMHANQELITEVLKRQAGFDGFLVSDWEGIHQIPDPSSSDPLTPLKVRVGVNAGTDMFMEPFSAKQFEDLLLAEVQAGRVSQARIDDAVRRILRQKFHIGLFEHPFASTDHIGDVGSATHRALARQAVAESQVLLKNSGHLLPLPASGSVYVAGRNADNIGNQAGGWTIQWQGESGNIIPGTTILQGIRQVAPSAAVTFSPDASAPMAGADVGIVVVGETPYSEGYGDIAGPECGWCSLPQQEEKSLSLQAGDKAVIDKVCGAIAKCVVLIVSGRPQIVTDQIGQIDALVASWLPGSEGAGVADVLFGRKPFTGRLPMTWPRSADQVPINVGDKNYDPLFPFGWGLRTNSSHDAFDAAQDAVVEGRAPGDWAALIASASVAPDDVAAATFLRRITG
jgi:beta-glucosidase